jgi:hypothetical protein
MNYTVIALQKPETNPKTRLLLKKKLYLEEQVYSRNGFTHTKNKCSSGKLVLNQYWGTLRTTDRNTSAAVTDSQISDNLHRTSGRMSPSKNTTGHPRQDMFKSFYFLFMK